MKRYGWGWGFPSRWQGWVALAVFVIAVLAGGVLLPLLLRDQYRDQNAFITAYLAIFGIYTLILTTALIALCVWKGERPRWRWGGPD